MGIRGLTTFLNEKPEKYFKRHLLKNCYVVVDGNCLAAILWTKACGRTGVFGGDYDRLGKAVIAWVNELMKAGICPVIIFDGGYERHKLRTVIKRMRAKVTSISAACPLGDGSQAFPILLRQAVRDAAIKAGAAVGQADLEADTELAALAKRLDCPVLSADSDFFLFGTQFAPLGHLAEEAEQQECGSWAIECNLFSGGPVPPSLLPLLAALLGNDFISRAALAPFRNRLGCLKRVGNHTYRRVRAIVEWLQDETFESAVAKILEPLRKKRKRAVLKLLAFVINNYTRLDTPLDKYILQDGVPLSNSLKEGSKEDLMKKLEEECLKVKDSDELECCVLDKDEEENDNEEEENEDDEEEEENYGDYKTSDEECKDENKMNGKKELQMKNDSKKQIKMINRWPDWYLECSRRGLLPPSLNTLLSIRRFFSTPQVEDYSRPNAGNVAVPLIRVLAGIMLGVGTFSYYSRKGSGYGKKVLTTAPPGPWGLSDIPKMDLTEQRKIIDDMLEIPSEILSLPNEWQLFGAAMVYWIRNMDDPPVMSYHIHALSLMLIAVYVFDLKIGHYRTKRPFMARYGRRLKHIANELENTELKIQSNSDSVVHKETTHEKKESTSESTTNLNTVESFSINDVPMEEVLHLWPQMCELYHTNPDLRTNLRAFRRIDIHTLAALQSILEPAIALNALLLNPYQHTQIHTLYNGTFMYNVSTRLSRSRDPMNAVAILLKSTPNLLKIHTAFVQVFLPHLRQGMLNPSVRIRSRKKNRKKKKSDKANIDDELTISDIDDLGFSDLENKFSILAKIS